MLDHMGFPVSDDDRAKRFYRAALGPLGYGRTITRTITRRSCSTRMGTIEAVCHKPA